MGALDPLFLWMAVACVATLLAHAAVTKTADLGLFEQHLAGFGVPAGSLFLLARVLPAAEWSAALLLLSPWRAAGSVLAAALLLLYAGAMATMRASGRTPDCGCGGEPLPVSWLLVARNVLLAALAGLPLWPVAGRALGWADFLVIAAALLLATLLYAALHQLLRLHTRRAARPLFRRS
jgi:hypothetical protein